LTVRTIASRVVTQRVAPTSGDMDATRRSTTRRRLLPRYSGWPHGGPG
jgi:hypothetical protein